MAAQSEAAPKRRPVLSSPLQEDAQQLYNLLWGYPAHTKHFIAPTPVSLERKHIGELGNTHVVAEKNDGERCLLLIGLPENEQEDAYIVLVNRSRKLTPLVRSANAISTQTYFHTPDQAQDIDLCNGTLLDGEWMPDDSFVVFDCVAAGGYDTKPIQSFHNRMRIAKACCRALQPFLTCRVKSFRPMDERMSILENPSGPADGLILMPKDEIVRTGRHETMFKWKPALKCTIDLLWHAGKEFCAVGNQGEPVNASMEVDSVSLVPPTPPTPLVSGMVYEIAPTTAADGKWKIVGPRPDKVAANHVVTIRRTLRTIRDNIQPEEIA